MGGEAFPGSDSKNDIWRTEDCIDWEMVVEHAPWQARNDAGCTVWNNKLWLFGGRKKDDADNTVYLNDLWNSEDGINWNPVETDTDRLAVMGTALVVLNGKLCIVGGIPEDGARVIWSSSDGNHWELWPYTSPWYSRTTAAGATFNGAMWLFGGEEYAGLRNDVWRSEDGANWELVTAQAPWAPRRGHAVVVHDGAMWLMGGNDRVGALNDVWRSTDGATWEEVTPAAAWDGRYFFGAAEMLGSLWVMGGISRSDEFADVWRSNDGVDWQEVTPSAPWGLRSNFGCAAHRGKLVIAGGVRWNDTHQSIGNTGEIWLSPDGLNWSVAEDQILRRDTSAMVSYGGQLWLTGGYGYVDPEGGLIRIYNDVYTSVDGEQWTRVIEEAPWSQRRAHVMLAHQESLWVISGEFGAGVTPSRNDEVWSSVGTLTVHTADQNRDGTFDLDELLRCIQFYNTLGLHCATEEDGSEDGYLAGAGLDHTCTPHNLDYAPQDWTISLDELLRAIRFYNTPEGYHPCEDGEDGFCPGAT